MIVKFSGTPILTQNKTQGLRLKFYTTNLPIPSIFYLFFNYLKIITYVLYISIQKELKKFVKIVQFKLVPLDNLNCFVKLKSC